MFKLPEIITLTITPNKAGLKMLAGFLATLFLTAVLLFGGEEEEEKQEGENGRPKPPTGDNAAQN